jgi:hypothetical protein
LGYNVLGVKSNIGDKGIEDYNVQLMKTDGITKQIYDSKVKINELGEHEITSLRLNEKSTNEVAIANQKVAEIRQKISKYDANRSDVQKVSAAATGLEGAIATGNVDNIKKATNELNKMDSGLKAVNKNALNLSESMRTALIKIVQWGVATGIVYGSLRKFQESVQYIKDLNKELISVRLVTGATAEDTAKLAKSYSDLAMELGSTTLEVAKGSLEFYRQGKTAEDTATLLKTSTMMSKLANLDAAQSTEYMTSMMNGFKLESQDMMGVLDSLISLDNAYATSVGRENCRNVWQHTDNIVNKYNVVG